ncbi:transcription factor UNE12-like isoform X2 [Argentina anserina]|uniref:transcription factor UNE12-like isoform X2 n=1 Tax=Argentina anserina TaxID=57926 RepID=UPI0021768A89|nr:transcription factor UNE12-like isoform X2 [Potentilla anserina]
MAEVVSSLVQMEGESSHNDPLQLMSLNFGGSVANNVSNTPHDDDKQKMIMEAGSSVNQTDVFALPWMAHSSMPAQIFVDFLAESSAYLPKSPYEDMLEKISLSDSGVHAAAGGVSDFQRDLLYGSSLGKSSGSKSIDFSLDMDPSKHTSWTDTFSGVSFDNTSQVDQKLTLAAPDIPSRPRQSAKRQISLVNERARKIRIAERVTALEELLPQSVEDGQEFVLDDVIDHIKFLQLQIKDLSKSRLGGEAITEPMIFREGYGHYFLHQQMLSEPLEEMIGKLLETNPVAADQLLKDKGLSVMPLSFTKNLF